MYGTLLHYVLAFRFQSGHIPGKAIAAADYLCRTYINPSKKFQMNITNDFPVRNIELRNVAETLDNTPEYASQTKCKHQQ